MIQITAQSNLVSNATERAYHEALKFVAKECLTAIAAAYGPFAKDQLIAGKDGNFVFTKDGKEILQALEFDNDLCNLIKNVILDAATIQGDKKGDSSTTLTVFTCLCILQFLEQVYPSHEEYYLTPHADNSAIECKFNQLLAEIVSEKLDTYDLDMITNLMYSITRDEEITRLCTEPFYKVDGIPFIIFQKDGLSNKLSITKEMEPKISARVTYSPVLEFFNKFEFNDAKVFLVNGSLDITDEDLLDSFMSLAVSPIIIIAQNMTPDTSRIVKSFSAKLQRNKLGDIAEQILSIRGDRKIQPLLVLTVEDSLRMNNEFFRGLSTVLYGSDNFMAIQGVSFDIMMKESLKVDGNFQYLQSIYKPDNPMTATLNELVAHNLDLSSNAKEIINGCYSTTHTVSFVENKLHFKYAALSAEATDLKSTLEVDMNSGSPVTSVKAKEVYQALFGSFIKINIGSDLALDRSNKYELVKDAVLTGKNAVEFGVHKGSIIKALHLKTASSNTFFGDIFDIMATISNTKVSDDSSVVDSYDSVMAALKNGFKTAKMLVESSGAIVRNIHNIHKPEDIVNK